MRMRHARALRRLPLRFGLLGAVLGLAAGPLLLAPAAQAAKPQPTPTATVNATPTGGSQVVDCSDSAQAQAAGGACNEIQPTFACIFANGNGSYTAALGYRNSSSSTLEFPVGSSLNSFYGRKGDAPNWGQPATYPPGTSVTAFTVTWAQKAQNTIQWALGGKTLAFSSASAPACTTHPVPIVGSVAAIGGTVLVGAVIFVWANRRAVGRLRAAGVRLDE